MKKNEQGFGAVEVILVVVIVALIGVVGFMVYKNHNKTAKNTTTAANSAKSSTTQTKTTPDPYTGWATYNDASVSLRYPDGWTVKDLSQGSGQQWTQIIAPSDDSISLSDTLNATNKHLVMDIRPLSQSTSATCREDCKIYDATSLTTAKSKSAKLVVSDWDSQGYAQAIEVTDDSAATVGAITYKLGATVGGKALRIYGNVNYDTNSSSGLIVDVLSFEKTQSFQNLVKVLNSATVK
jgi:Tfp pilus assembly protein PilE